MKITVIDFARLGESDERDRLYGTSSEYGFFALENHGIDMNLQRHFAAQMQTYFNQPIAEKLKQERTEKNPFGFYNKELTKIQLDQKEIFDLSLSEPTLWPDQHEFKAVTSAWFEACHSVATQLLAHLFASLELPAPVSAFNQHSSFLRLNYYPKFVKGDDDFEQFGVSHHTDAGALTLLLQEEVASLQFLHEDTWHTVPASRDTLLVNLGDMVQVWSNDQFIAPLHRVLTNSDRNRYSAPYFLNPDYKSVITPLLGEKPRYRAISWQEFRSGRAAGDYADLGEEIQISQYRLEA